MENKQLLEKQIEQLGLSSGFCATCRKMGFENLKGIIAVSPETLINRHGFTFHWLSELISYLEEHNALHLLQGQSKQENISG